MLTREQIQNMPAGFEITTLVAQQVMGHKWLTYLRYPGEQVRFLVAPTLLPDLLKEYELWEPSGEVPTRIVMAQHVLPFATGSYNFSNDIADAWQVVEKMRQRGFWSMHTDLSLDSATEWWSWHFNDHAAPGNHSVTAQAETVPLAICRAALLATLPAAAPTIQEGTQS